MVDFKKLKSGSDIRGTAWADSGEVSLSDPVVYDIVRGFVSFICEKLGKGPEKLTVAVGNDSRISGPRLNSCVCKALTESGINVLNCGLISTPAMFMTTLKETLDCDASIMITASHHPFDKNGLKFFTKEGGLEGGDISAILANAGQKKFFPNDKQGNVKKTDFKSVYADILRDKIKKATGQERPLEGFKIVVDAGNGAGGFFADLVLKPLGADTSGSQFLEPDGMFPNHIPNPEDKQAMEAIRRAVVENKADFGIIFDTDVDRAGAVFSDGEEINRNRLIALISAILLEEEPGAYIVTDSITSDGLAEFIAERGGHHHRFKRGYKNVINEAIRLNREGKSCPLAIETSGHAALRENYFLDDGAYLIVRLLIKMARLKKEDKTLADLIADLKAPLEEKEIRMEIKVSDFASYGAMVLQKLKEYSAARADFKPAKENYEGYRVSFASGEGDGWFLLRMSLHDPIMPLNIESNSPGGTKVIAKKLYDFLKDFEELDTAKLAEFIK